MIPNLSSLCVSIDAPAQKRLGKNYDRESMASIHGDKMEYEENRASKKKKSGSGSNEDKNDSPSPFQILPNEISQSILINTLDTIKEWIRDGTGDTDICKRVAELCYSVTKDTMSINCDTQTFWDEMNRLLHFYTDRWRSIEHILSITPAIYSEHMLPASQNLDISWDEFVNLRKDGKIVFMEQTEAYKNAWLANFKNDHPWWAMNVPTTPKQHFIYMCKKKQFVLMSNPTIVDLYERFDLEGDDSYLGAFFSMFGLTEEQINSGVQIPGYTEVVEGMLTSEKEGKWYNARSSLKSRHAHKSLFRNFDERVRFNIRNISQHAVQINWKNLEYVGPKLQADALVVFPAIIVNCKSAVWMSPSLGADRGFVDLCLLIFNLTFKFNVGDHAAAQVQYMYEFFRKVSDEIKSDIEFAKKAVLVDGSNMSWAPEALKKNVEFVKEVIQLDRHSLYAAETYVDEAVVLQAEALLEQAF